MAEVKQSFLQDINGPLRSPLVSYTWHSVGPRALTGAPLKQDAEHLIVPHGASAVRQIKLREPEETPHLCDITS